jgi:hypothetical protein
MSDISPTIKHGKLLTTTSYYDGDIASQKQELEVSIYSSKESILKDIIDAMSVISSGESSKLDLCIKVDAKKRYQLVKRWRIEQ